MWIILRILLLARRIADKHEKYKKMTIEDQKLYKKDILKGILAVLASFIAIVLMVVSPVFIGIIGIAIIIFIIVKIMNSDKFV